MSLEYLDTTSEKLEYLINLLVSRATGNEKVSNYEYQALREELLADDKLKNTLPSFVKTHSSISSFWPFIKGKGNYDERRKYINYSFQEARSCLKSNTLLVPNAAWLATSKDFIRAELKKYFDKNTVIKNIYGYFTLTEKIIGNGGTSEVKKFEFNGQQFAIKFLHENIAEKESKAGGF